MLDLWISCEQEGIIALVGLAHEHVDCAYIFWFNSGKKERKKNIA